MQFESQYILDHAYVHRWRGHGRSGKKPSAYDPVVGSYATFNPLLDSLGHDAEMTGHDPEIGGHAAEMIGHDRPEYAAAARPCSGCRREPSGVQHLVESLLCKALAALGEHVLGDVGLLGHQRGRANGYEIIKDSPNQFGFLLINQQLPALRER